MKSKKINNLTHATTNAVEEASQDSKKRQGLIKEYEKIESKLRKWGKPFSDIPQIEHFEKLLDDIKSDKSDQALSEASKIYETVLQGQKNLESLQELKKAAEHAAKAQKTGANRNFTTPGQALKAISEAYRVAEATLSDRYRAATEVADSSALLLALATAPRKTKAPRTPDAHKSGPWGYFRIAAPILPEDAKREFSQPTGLPVLRAYSEILNSLETRSLSDEGRISKNEENLAEEVRDHD